MTTLEIARMIDHSVLHPTATDGELRKHCAMALLNEVAAVCVKPYHVELASTLLKDSQVKVCSVVGFPHGNSTSDVKAMEAVEVIHNGAKEIDVVVNIGKVIQEDWDYVDHEIEALMVICNQHQILLKVIFETDFVTADRHKIRLCEICNKNSVGFVKTSTGFGYVPAGDGHYHYHGATEHDVKLMREHCIPAIQVKASGGIKTLDQLLRLYELGTTRFGTSSTEGILAEARMRLA